MKTFNKKLCTKEQIQLLSTIDNLNVLKETTVLTDTNYLQIENHSISLKLYCIILELCSYGVSNPYVVLCKFLNKGNFDGAKIVHEKYPNISGKILKNRIVHSLNFKGTEFYNVITWLVDTKLVEINESFLSTIIPVCITSNSFTALKFFVEKYNLTLITSNFAYLDLCIKCTDNEEMFDYLTMNIFSSGIDLINTKFFKLQALVEGKIKFFKKLGGTKFYNLNDFIKFMDKNFTHVKGIQFIVNNIVAFKNLPRSTKVKVLVMCCANGEMETVRTILRNNIWMLSSSSCNEHVDFNVHETCISVMIKSNLHEELLDFIQLFDLKSTVQTNKVHYLYLSIEFSKTIAMYLISTYVYEAQVLKDIWCKSMIGNETFVQQLLDTHELDEILETDSIETLELIRPYVSMEKLICGLLLSGNCHDCIVHLLNKYEDYHSYFEHNLMYLFEKTNITWSMLNIDIFSLFGEFDHERICDDLIDMSNFTNDSVELIQYIYKYNYLFIKNNIQLFIDQCFRFNLENVFKFLVHETNLITELNVVNCIPQKFSPMFEELYVNLPSMQSTVKRFLFDSLFLEWNVYVYDIIAKKYNLTLLERENIVKSLCNKYDSSIVVPFVIDGKISEEFIETELFYRSGQINILLPMIYPKSYKLHGYVVLKVKACVLKNIVKMFKNY